MLEESTMTDWIHRPIRNIAIDRLADIMQRLGPLHFDEIQPPELRIKIEGAYMEARQPGRMMADIRRDVFRRLIIIILLEEEYT
jgi:hypothetical protein